MSDKTQRIDRCPMCGGMHLEYILKSHPLFAPSQDSLVFTYIVDGEEVSMEDYIKSADKLFRIGIMQGEKISIDGNHHTRELVNFYKVEGAMWTKMLVKIREKIKRILKWATRPHGPTTA